MREKIVTVLFAVGVVWGSFQLGGDVLTSTNFYVAILVGTIPVLICGSIILRNQGPDRRFLARVFIAALAARYFLAYIIYSKNLQAFLGGDALTYNGFGYALAQSWMGLVDENAFWLVRYTNTQTSGFGMFYLVAGVYYVIGQNQFAIQLINCGLGAGASIAAYKIAMLVYPNERVARSAAIMTAFSPSLILWTSQALKDGPIVLCICLCILYTLKVRTKVEVKSFILLLVSLGCLYTLRHYMSYIMFTAIAGAFLFTTTKKFTPFRMLQGAVLVMVIGLAFSYFGAGESARTSLDLKRIQSSREWNAKAANSGFGGDVDITDPKAAIEFLPLGLLYVLFAPFPWMISNLRQLITLPELIAWWCLFPMMLKGYWFVIRNRLRESFVVCT
ncbi:MAG: glycosyltransferase family 39 protein, partial [Blastocatellia bacterium]